MAMRVVPEKSSTDSHPDSSQVQTGELRYTARQPILDLGGKVHGYKLLFWNGREPAFRAQSSAAIRTMLDNAVIQGLEQLACGLPAFVDCSVDVLTDNWVEVLPPDLTVAELQATTKATPDLLDACRKLKESGFRLALSGFTGSPESKPLLELADYVKVDIASIDPIGRRDLLRQLGGALGYLVAENVQTSEEYGMACAEGFELFQGYYFCRPEPLRNHRIPANRLVHMEILEILQKDPVDLVRLSQLVLCDASLTYRFLRLVNSPLYAMRQEVTSIQSALLLLGEETARRIAMLAIASDFVSDQPIELLRMALVRGRFCELGASLCGLNPSEQYLIGMISLFPAMLRIVMEDLLSLLPLRDQACNALLGKMNPEGLLLHWLICYEHAQWAECDAVLNTHGLRHEQIMRCHAEAIAWADTTLNAAA